MKALLRLSTALPVVIAALAVPAHAQQANPAAEEASDAPVAEIVVTAQKRSENLQKVPLAVSVLSGEALAQAARPSIESAAQMVPSLNFLKSGTTLNQTIFLRGVGTATFSIAGEPSVSTVVDGVVYARSGEAFSDLVDIAQMEVLRGPQGTLFGKNASAGVINITTQMPKHELGGSVEASYFDRNEFRAKAVLNVPLGTDLAGRFTGFYGEYDGNIRNVTRNTWVNGYKHYGARGQVLYDPSADLRIYVAADYHKNDDNCCAEVIGTGALTGAGVPTTSLAFNVLPSPQGADTRAVAQDLITATKEEGWGVSAQADIAVGSHTLTSITSYRKWNNTEIRDGDWLDRAYAGFNQLHDNGPQRTNTFTQELRLTSPGKQFLDYVLGAYYSRAYSERTFQRDDVVCNAAVTAPANTLIPCGSVNADPSTFPSAVAQFGSTFRNFALFGQATVNFTDRLRIVGGLRYSHDELSVFHSRNTTLAGPAISPSFPATTSGTGQPAAPFTDKTSKDNLSGKAAIQFDASRDVVAYASYTRGYKGPAYNIFFNLSATGTNVIDAETSDAFEVGLKNTLLDGRMTLNIAGFFAKYHNFQANNPDLVAGSVVSRFTNAGEVSTRGIEMDLNWRPVSDLSITGGLAYTNAHVDQFKVAPGAAPTAIIAPGSKLAYAPEWKGSLAADYRWRTGSIVDVFFGVQGNYQSSQISLFTPNTVQTQFGTIPAYGLVNVSLGIGDASDKYRLTFQVRNVFDQSYISAVQAGGPGGSFRYQIPRDADRYWGLTGRVNF
ncbi:TonB-dependent receptor [Novosphingobium flavum]|uniref:TonB-dependent receptor n=1 Tax=Novosphingobium flavum TaxID=1778672 RepID=A0A7X1FQP6_9SPHN|nr:TonB-dependent receptor [Novosphingobium flavum]MBC2665210.1 TonB-dependent receptor [Novosphingobium flavum]